MPDLEEELDRLYGLSLEEFTAARNELAARLKQEGEADAAAAVKGLAKPTASAAILNQLARREPELVQRLLAAGADLRQAQEQTLAGGGADDLHRAMTAERRAVQDLVHAAGELGERPLSQAALDRVHRSLSASSADDEARGLLERGRVTKDFERVGFPAFASAPAAKPRRPDRAQNELAERRKRREEERERLLALRARLRELKRDEASARQAADRAERDAAQARAAAAELAAEVKRVEAELADAET